MTIVTQRLPQTEPVGTTDFHQDGVQLPGVDLVAEAPDPPERKAGGPLDRHLWAVGFSLLHHLKPAERIVLDGMADHANPQGVFHLKMETLATYCGLSRKGVLDISARLYALGAVETLSSGRGRKSESFYRLTGCMTGWTINQEKPNPTSKDWRRKHLETKPAPAKRKRQDSNEGVRGNVTPGDIIIDGVMSPGRANNVTPGDITEADNVTRLPKNGSIMSPGVTYNPVTLNPKKKETNPDNDNPAAKTASLLSSLSFSQRDEETEFSEDLEDPTTCEDCEAPKFRDHRLCIAHLVALFWPQLGSSWSRGRRAAVRWYEANPDDFEEQLRDAAPNVLEDFLGIEVAYEEISAPAAPPARPLDLGGGTFRCDLCGTTVSFDLAFDGVLHRDYSCGDENGNLERRRCGGTWEGISELQDVHHE